MRKLLLFLLLLPTIAFAQGTATNIRNGATLPTACANGDIFYKTTSPIGVNECSVPGNPGTWRRLYPTSSSITALFSGTCDSTTYLRGDGACSTPGGSGTVTHTVGALTANRIVVGNDSADVDILSSLGTTTTVLHGNASGRPSFGAVTGSDCPSCVTASSPGAGVAHFAGSTQSVTSSAVVGSDMTNNTVTSTQLAVVNTRRTCMMTVGDGANSVSSGDYSPFKVNRCYIPYAATIVEVLLQSDAGTPSVQLQKRHGASTVTDLLSGALAAAGTTKTCAMSATSQTCIDGTTSSGSITVSTTALAAGDYIEVKSGTASTETNMTIAVTFVVN